MDAETAETAYQRDLAAERQAEKHGFQEAEEHEFCSWCGAPNYDDCHWEDK